MQRHPQLQPGVLDRRDDVRVDDVGQGPRLGVDQVSLDPAVGQGRRHLEPQGRGVDDDGRADLVEDLVPLHRLADVLDVVQAAEVAAGNARVLVVEAGGHHEPVPGHLALASHLCHLPGQVQRLDLGLVVDVDACVDVGLLLGQEERLEGVDLTAVDVGDSAGAVAHVFELGVDDDLVCRVRSLHSTRGTDARRSATDHQDLVWHGVLPSGRMAEESRRSFSIGNFQSL